MTSLIRNQVLLGDARVQLGQLRPASVDMVLTSPPYFRLRDYHVAGQLGIESHVDDWVVGLRAVCAEVARVLRPSGSFWLNVADTYANDHRQGARPRSFLLGPERLLLALQADGWLVRNKIVWAKTNPMPTPARNRLATTHESLYLLTLSDRYFFDLDATRQPHKTSVSHRQRTPTASKRDGWRGSNAASDLGLHALKAAGLVGHPLGKNPGDVWALATSAFHGPHPATFPVTLAERAIRAGCPLLVCGTCDRAYRQLPGRSSGGAGTEGPVATCECQATSRPGLVLDPFMGAGSTAVAAARLGRDWLGIELNREFADVARRRLEQARIRGP